MPNTVAGQTTRLLFKYVDLILVGRLVDITGRVDSASSERKQAMGL